MTEQIDTMTIPTDTDQYLIKAKSLVAAEFNRLYPNLRYQALPAHFYIVVFTKVLRNWKALVSTDLLPGLYWEITYDGNREQAYLDTYTKTRNTAVTDEGYLIETQSYPLP